MFKQFYDEQAGTEVVPSSCWVKVFVASKVKSTDKSNISRSTDQKKDQKLINTWKVKSTLKIYVNWSKVISTYIDQTLDNMWVIKYVHLIKSNYLHK